jgi:trans-aconitate 2-methyltransferase
MSDWNASAYSRFEEERTRPARDLLARVTVPDARTIVDLGCGPGNSTALLVKRFSGATVTGLDGSPDMLAAATRRLPGARFEQADIGRWAPAAPLDVIYSNAALQWVPDHDRLFPALMGYLAPGGVLAVQMPDNLAEPSHVAMRTVAAMESWRDKLAFAGEARTGLKSAAGYVDLLCDHASEIDVWRTTYHHRLADVGAIVTWFRTSGLRPYVDSLDEGQQAAFLAAYEAEFAKSYQPLDRGGVLLPFPRLFIVARR